MNKVTNSDYPLIVSQLALHREKLARPQTGDSATDLDWPRHTCSILTQLSSTLAATLDNVRKYEQVPELGLDVSDASDSLFYKKIRMDLRRTCDGLSDCQRSLCALREILILEQGHNNRSLHLARGQATEVRILSWVTLMSQPLVTAAAIFGCGDIVLALPRMPPPVLFLSLLLCTGVVAAGIIFMASQRATKSLAEWGVSRPLVADMGPQRDRDESKNLRRSPNFSRLLGAPALGRSDMLAFPPRRKIQ
ncbi:uncharacterized protein BDZ83DRAFT_19062 [Colletotrichum acutatum]|uniref:Uncharacterized protein n=1 Tax=Glomerella acutata TaxID=27357 RepID=A0AAD8UH54_GLOAC|nr:uncharacterized protein BDZ83DRAFT_19062 [Colletotrichum acutatum]KAK1718734.1 hypothetical protein BDZ83DRAFT_19062 [Colletotrichum acutatum]